MAIRDIFRESNRNLFRFRFWYRSHTESTYSVNDSILVFMFWFRFWYRYVPVQFNLLWQWIHWNDLCFIKKIKSLFEGTLIIVQWIQNHTDDYTYNDNKFTKKR